MPSMFKKKAQHVENAKFVMVRIAAMAPPGLKSWVTIVTSFVWAKNFKMAELRCRQNIDILDQSTEIRDLLCTILPEFAQFVEIRRRAKG